MFWAAIWVSLLTTSQSIATTRGQPGSVVEDQQRQYAAVRSAPSAFSSPRSYCTASGGCDEYITRVEINDIDNVSGCDQYHDYTALATTVLLGTEYPITVTNGIPYSTDVCSIWVDWNQDGVFDDGGPECVGDVYGEGLSPPYSFTLTIPPDALCGPTRLRIRIDYNNPNPEPCGDRTYGEVEDYTLLVTSPEAYGACCDPYTGNCLDQVHPLDCTGQWSQQTCAALYPPCGDPGCCCDSPEPGEPAAPHFAYRANCAGRFIPGLLGEDCLSTAFEPTCGLWKPTNLLYAPTYRDDPAFRAAVAAITLSDVDYFDARSRTPTLAELLSYEAVFTWPCYEYDSRFRMGNVLADYVDRGGRVILGERTCQAPAGGGLRGRIMTPEYCPVSWVAYDLTDVSYAGDGSTCFHDDVVTYSSTSLNVVSVADLADSDGTLGGHPSLAWRTDGKQVIYSAGNRAGAFGAGDWAQMTANAIRCPVPDPGGACCDHSTYADPDNPWLGGLCTDVEHASECATIAGQFFYDVQCDALPFVCGEPGACCDDRPGYPAPCEVTLRALCTDETRFAIVPCEALQPACGLWQPAGVLMVPTYYDDAGFRSAVSALLGGAPVDYLSPCSATPTIEQLRPYVAVVTWVWADYADHVGMGDVLADYVDGGGRVILGIRSDSTGAWQGLGGRIMTPEYYPVVTSTYIGSVVYSGDGAGFPFDGPAGRVGALAAGVTEIITQLQPGAAANGTWTIGSPVLAYWPDFRVCYCSGYVTAYVPDGDWALLTANMVLAQPVPGACCSLETAECTDHTETADCLDRGPQWRTYPGALCSDLSPVCGDPGACCDHDTGQCSDNVLRANCAASGRQFSSSLACADLDPPCGNPGACCDPDSGACIDDALEATCQGPTRQFHLGVWCSSLQPPCGDPGCCCDWPEAGAERDPHFAFRADCNGRFIPGAYTICGDLDENGVVDMNDYDLFLDAFGRCAGQPGYAAAADLDSDGCVSLTDFQVWRNCYSFQGTECTAQAFGTPCGTLIPSGLLCAAAGDDQPEFRAAVAAIIHEPVDYVNTHFGTPTMPQMLEYAAVMVWADYPYSFCNNVELGDRLADYVDDGGRVILGQGCWPTYYTHLAGRIMTADYCPVADDGGISYSTVTYAGPSADCATLLGPVYELSSDWIDIITGLVPGAGSDGEFSNGSPVAIWRPDRRVYYSPGNRGMAWGLTGDWAQLTANFMLCRDGDLYGACCDLYHQPEPGSPGYCGDDVELADCAAPLRLYPDETCAELIPPCGSPGACCDDLTASCTDGVLKANCSRRHAPGTGCSELNPTCGDLCLHSIELEQCWGWCGDWVDVYVDGARVLDHLALPEGGYWATYDFWAATGSVIHTIYHTSPCYDWGCYSIYDGVGLLLAEDGDDSYRPTGVTVTGNCDVPMGACCDRDSGVCTDDVSIFDCSYGFLFLQDQQCAELFPPCGACYDAVISAPGSWTGNTCGAHNDCALRWSEDLIVQVTIPSDGDWVFSLCGATWDTYLYVADDCCTNVWSNDNSPECSPSTVASRLAIPDLTAGTYYATIEGRYTFSCGSVTLAVSTAGPAAPSALSPPAETPAVR
jgi:hypothetical protein